MPTVPVYFSEEEYGLIVQTVCEINDLRKDNKKMKVSNYIHDKAIGLIPVPGV